MHRRGFLGGGTAAGMLGATAGGSGAMAEAGLGHVEIGAAAPDFALDSLLEAMPGHRRRLSEGRGRPVVLEWTSPVCPYTAIKYRRGYIQAVQARAAARGASWLSIDTAPPGAPGYLTPAAARTRVEVTGARITALLSDPDGRVARAYGVRVTPSLFLISAEGRLAFQGGLDDRPELDLDPGDDDLTRALADLAAGRPVNKPVGRAYGCAVEYPLTPSR